MSKTRWICALAAGAALLAPAAAQPVPVAPQIEVNDFGAHLKCSVKIEYLGAAVPKGLHGTVVAETDLDADRSMTAVRILSGPEGLRKTVIDWMRSCQFAHDVPVGKRQIRVAFWLPGERMSCCDPPPAGEAGMIAGQATESGPAAKRIRVSGAAQALKLISTVAPIPRFESVRISGIVGLRAIIGQDGIVQSLSPLSGPPLLISAAGDAAMQWLYQPTVIDGEPVEVDTTIDVRFPPLSDESGETPPRIHAGNLTSGGQLIVYVKPVYPPEAKQAGILGTVEFSALIGKDGHVRDLKVVRGHPLLIRPALDAVKQWVYKPTMLNGEPLEVRTTILVPFTLQ